MMDYDALSRTQWLALADGFYAGLRRDVQTLGPSEWQRTSRYFGWRKRDVLAHMASAIPVNFRQVLDRALAGDPSAPSEFDTFARNGREVARRRTRPVEELLDELWSGLEAILRIYRGVTDDRWLAPAWFFVGPVSVRTLFLAQLGDNVFHARDLLLGTVRWRGLDTDVAGPLVDWFLRELRPALFRRDRAGPLRATVLYRVTGAVTGAWTMRIADGRCQVARGSNSTVEVTIEADAEDLVAAAQARAAPFVGRLARQFEGIRGARHREDVVATITGYASTLAALLMGRVRISGDRALARRVNGSFWHFWERTEQTERSIAASRG